MERRDRYGWLLLGSAALAASCAAASSGPSRESSTTFVAEDPTAQADAEVEPTCPHIAIENIQIPFVSEVFSLTENRGRWDCVPTNTPDHDNAPNLRMPEPRKICLSAQAGTPGTADLVFSLSTRNESGTVLFHALDAMDRGIDRVEFALETPPPDGLVVELSSVAQVSCPEDPLDCVHAGFSPTASDGTSPLRLTKEGVQQLRLAAFKPAATADPSRALDVTMLAELHFKSVTAEFDFCVRELRFLDVAGNPVAPL